MPISLSNFPPCDLKKKKLLQVQLCPYDPDVLDESVLWTESRDIGDGFRALRMVNNIRLNFDAFHGDKNHGGVHDGTILVLWEWKKGDNQRWKIVPYCKFSRCHIIVFLLRAILQSMIPRCDMDTVGTCHGYRDTDFIQKKKEVKYGI